MKNRKEFQELNRMAYPILLHYLLTSLFEILDQAIVGHYSVRGFAVVGIAVLPVFPSVLDAKSRKLPPKQREMVLF